MKKKKPKFKKGQKVKIIAGKRMIKSIGIDYEDFHNRVAEIQDCETGDLWGDELNGKYKGQQNYVVGGFLFPESFLEAN